MHDDAEVPNSLKEVVRQPESIAIVGDEVTALLNGSEMQQDHEDECEPSEDGLEDGGLEEGEA